MFSKNGQLHIPVSGGTSWVRVHEGSKYSSQERWMDGNLYAPLSEVNRPIHSTPISTSGGSISTAPDLRSFPTATSPTTPLWTLSPDLYRYYYHQQEEAKEQERRQQEAVINKQLDRAASEQYGTMDKLYKQGGLDEMRKEYNRVRSANAESIYTKAAYNALCAKENEEEPIRGVTTYAANKYYKEGGIEGLTHLINYYKSNGHFNYASVAQSVLSAKEKEETINTPAVTKGANEYYETGGMEGLKHLVKYYEENNYPVYANIAKKILKQKEEQEREQEHNRRMGHDLEYAENYKIKQAESEIRKLESEMAEREKINPFYGQLSCTNLNERIKAFEYTKGLSYEAAKAYFEELKLPKNARFENSKIGADVALQYYFDKVIPLKNKIEQEQAKIQKIENARTERMLKEKEEQEEKREKIKQLKEKQEEKQITDLNGLVQKQKLEELNQFFVAKPSGRDSGDMTSDILNRRVDTTQNTLSNKQLPCYVAGGIDNVIYGFSEERTDSLCHDKNSFAYKAGEYTTNALFFIRNKGYEATKYLLEQAEKFENISDEIERDLNYVPHK